ncbi:unnamed protein product [Rangifer tarandus platyrhynchus]|uniref:Uncharacterized protein n=2 Tax=Rangifer tarandus platyrhynchus TaxID=3082113 RepID=A0ABN8XX35_RANTA|nr:unnamed protein product [Rangifer tarandus platyrhynchus]CAI9692446.1 unnamed protein product [Rangifer tarandus platyrhynchus]
MVPVKPSAQRLADSKGSLVFLLQTFLDVRALPGALATRLRAAQSPVLKEVMVQPEGEGATPDNFLLVQIALPRRHGLSCR